MISELGRSISDLSLVMLINSSGQAYQSELVEDSRAEALPTMLRQAQHDTRFLIKPSSLTNKASIQNEEAASLLSMTKV